jgi:hypothetical protein
MHACHSQQLTLSLLLFLSCTFTIAVTAGYQQGGGGGYGGQGGGGYVTLFETVILVTVFLVTVILETVNFETGTCT